MDVADREPERAAFAAPKRRQRVQSMAQSEADRHGVEPQRDRRAGHGPVWGKAQAQEVLGQSSFYSVNDRRLHFGLGAAKAADLEVRWPNGRRDVFKDVPGGALVTIREGQGIVKA